MLYQDACGQELYCIYWQMLEKDCWLHLADAKSKKDSDFGNNNCKDGKPAGRKFVSLFLLIYA